MPISQERLISLIKIVDEAISSQKTLRELIKAYTKEATDVFYNEPETASSKLLAYIQAIDAAIAEPLLSFNSIETLATEREHFKLRKASNIRAAKSMQKRRMNI
jgi:hypothetical protein